MTASSQTVAVDSTMATPTTSNEHKSATRSSTSIRRELQQLRGDLFDISDVNSSVALVLNKVQQLTEFENEVVLEQRGEIETLRAELEEARQQHVQDDDRDVDEEDSYEAADSLGWMPSFESVITMESNATSSIDRSRTSEITNESERDVSYSIDANQQLATRANLSQSIAAASAELIELNFSRDAVTKDLQESKEELQELKKSKDQIIDEINRLKKDHLQEPKDKIQESDEELQELTKSKDRMVDEIDRLKEQVQSLQNERDKLLIQEVEAYTHQTKLAQELERSQESNHKLNNEVKTLREEMTRAIEQIKTADQQAREARESALQEQRLAQGSDEAIAKTQEETTAETMIRNEMQCEVEQLREDKVECEKLLEAMKRSAVKSDGKNVISSNTLGLRSSGIVGNKETDVQRLKSEIEALRSENAMLRSTTKSDSEVMLGEVPSSVVANVSIPITHNSYNAASPQANASPTASLNSTGSGSLKDAISDLHETESLLFGNGSLDGKSTKSGDRSSRPDAEEGTIKSDSEGIRSHADLMLYWTSPIPKTIGLPLRSRVSESSQLSPRCPPQTVPFESALHQKLALQDTAGMDDGDDKENCGAVIGAFPKLPPKQPQQQEQQQQRKKNVSLSENDTIIHNLEYPEDAEEAAPIMYYECSASPFSGNDPQSEFYLPKLGLAGDRTVSNIKERTSFSENPTALSNILRQWQCDFLSTQGVTAANELLKAHKADANGMSRKMKKWRNAQGMSPARSKECYVALKIWSRTCKAVLRSIREQKATATQKHGPSEECGEEGGDVGDAESLIIERPHFLDITFADTHNMGHLVCRESPPATMDGIRHFYSRRHRRSLLVFRWIGRRKRIMASRISHFMVRLKKFVPV